MVIWRGILEATDEKAKDENRMDSEIDIELAQFMKGYFEGLILENGWPQLLKLKDWPSPSMAEEFLLYQRPEFINKLPLLQYIHSKWGLLNVAAKLPHYSLQNDVGPKIYICYGISDELGRGDSVTNLHFNMRDMDVPILTKNLKIHWKEFGKSDDLGNEFVEWPLYDGAIFLDKHHKRNLKEEFELVANVSDRATYEGSD
ncbi:hypothetical protein JHK82_047921 [Glycine max]|nr:hypothetical protein JHK82_047921 [Glycine max]